MSSIITNVLKDGVSVYPEGCERAVSANSMVFGVERISTSLIPATCGSNPVPYINALKISDPYLGNLWVDETKDSFADKINQANCPTCEGENSIFSAIAEEGTSLTDARFEGKQVVLLNTNGQTYSRTNDFTQSGDTITLLGLNSFANDQLVWVTVI